MKQLWHPSHRTDSFVGVATDPEVYVLIVLTCPGFLDSLFSIASLTTVDGAWVYPGRGANQGRDGEDAPADKHTTTLLIMDSIRVTLCDEHTCRYAFAPFDS